MNDVTFFSYSTGGIPRIWATDSVDGTFQSIPETGHTVELTGDNINAGFEVLQWQNNHWGAQIAGAVPNEAPDSNRNASLTFRGHAGGKYENNDTSINRFSGNGTGIVDP